jgi:Primase C terminal 1 (PriCT-1)
VVAPPSIHQSGRRHRLLPSPNGKLADLPEWMPKALVERQHADAGSAATVTKDVDVPPILRGIRNRTLFKMACSLRARGADYPTIAATLSANNAKRCSPPLEHTETVGIVKSACRYAPSRAAPYVNGEVHAELDTFAPAVYGAPWRGKDGKGRLYVSAVHRGAVSASTGPITPVFGPTTATLPVHRSLASHRSAVRGV